MKPILGHRQPHGTKNAFETLSALTYSEYAIDLNYKAIISISTYVKYSIVDSSTFKDHVHFQEPFIYFFPQIHKLSRIVKGRGILIY